MTCACGQNKVGLHRNSGRVFACCVEAVSIGDRIRLLHMEVDPDPIPVGSWGTVTGMAMTVMGPQTVVTWDSGRRLMLVAEDRFLRVPDMVIEEAL